MEQFIDSLKYFINNDFENIEKTIYNLKIYEYVGLEPLILFNGFINRNDNYYNNLYLQPIHLYGHEIKEMQLIYLDDYKKITIIDSYLKFMSFNKNVFIEKVNNPIIYINLNLFECRLFYYNNNKDDILTGMDFIKKTILGVDKNKNTNYLWNTKVMKGAIDNNNIKILKYVLIVNEKLLNYGLISYICVNASIEMIKWLINNNYFTINSECMNFFVDRNNLNDYIIIDEFIKQKKGHDPCIYTHRFAASCGNLEILEYIYNSDKDKFYENILIELIYGKRNKRNLMDIAVFARKINIVKWLFSINYPLGVSMFKYYKYYPELKEWMIDNKII